MKRVGPRGHRRPGRPRDTCARRCCVTNSPPHCGSGGRRSSGGSARSPGYRRGCAGCSANAGGRWRPPRRHWAHRCQGRPSGDADDPSGQRPPRHGCRGGADPRPGCCCPEAGTGCRSVRSASSRSSSSMRSGSCRGTKCVPAGSTRTRASGIAAATAWISLLEVTAPWRPANRVIGQVTAPPAGVVPSTEGPAARELQIAAVAKTRPLDPAGMSRPRCAEPRQP